MIGRLEFARGGRGRGVPGELYGIPVLLARADPEGRFGEYRLRRAGKGLRRGGVERTLLPEDFANWELLQELGLKGIDPSPLLRAAAPELALEALRQRDVDPRRATVALAGGRTDGGIFRCAAALCSKVRRIVVDVPGGERLALRLREEFGIPVLPPEHPAQLALCFQPEKTRREVPKLELFGRKPDLDGLKLVAPGLAQEDRCALDVLTFLWEWGKLPRNGIKIHGN